MLDFSVISNEDDDFLLSDSKPIARAVVEKPAQKRKRRRKTKAERKANAAYNPRQSSRGSNANFDPSARGIIQLMGASTPEAKKAAVRGSQVAFSPGSKTQILKSPDYQASTPNRITSRFLVTPQGKTKLIPSRVIKIQDQEVSIYLPKEKVKTERLAIPLFPDEAFENLNMPESSFDATLDIPITLDDIHQAAKEKKKAKRNGDPVRSPTQEEVMGISARKALEAAGIVVPKRSVHWAHFVSHSIQGNKAQVINNLGLATKFCNAEMELLNPVLKKILCSKGHPDTLYLSFYPSWVKGYEKIRLLDNLSVEIKDGAGTDYKRRVKFTFDALTLKPICLSEIQIVEKILLDAFQATTPLASETVLLSPQGLLSPSKRAQRTLYPQGDSHMPSTPTRFKAPDDNSACTEKMQVPGSYKSMNRENLDDFSLSLYFSPPVTPLFAKEKSKRCQPSSLFQTEKMSIPKFSLSPAK